MKLDFGNERVAYKLSELATKAGVSAEFLRRERRAGRLRARRIGRRGLVVTPEDWAEYTNLYWIPTQPKRA